MEKSRLRKLTWKEWLVKRGSRNERCRYACGKVLKMKWVNYDPMSGVDVYKERGGRQGEARQENG
jgi:hypothetical protein